MRSSLLFALFLLVACSSDDDSGGLFGNTGGAAGTTSAEACVPNRQQACSCGDALGLQICTSDRTFGPCICEGAGGASSGGSSAKGGSAGNVSKGGSSGKGGSAGGGGASVAGSGGSASGTTDPDGDGFTGADGDCDNSNPAVNPGAFEVPGNDLDDDCNGQVDDAATECDADLGPVLSNAQDAVRVLGLCNIGAPAKGAKIGQRRQGVITASWSNVAGAFHASPPVTGASTTLQIGSLPNFGSATTAQDGQRLLAMSSGIARATGQESAPAAQCSNTTSFGSATTQPPGFPKPSAICEPGGAPNDAIAIDVTLRVPNNAKSFSVRYKFFTCEYPQFTCTDFNDIFALIMTPSPLASGDPMADATNTTANVVFESREDGGKNVINANNTSLLTACKPATAAPKHLACQNESGLAGSGFEGHAATGWLEAKVPVPTFADGDDRVITLRYAIWDSRDNALDSTVAIDRFRWSTDALPEPKTVVVP